MIRPSPLLLAPLAALLLSCQQKIDLDATILEGEDEAGSTAVGGKALVEAVYGTI